jgi:hypothetical protein
MPLLLEPPIRFHFTAESGTTYAVRLLEQPDGRVLGDAQAFTQHATDPAPPVKRFSVMRERERAVFRTAQAQLMHLPLYTVKPDAVKAVSLSQILK